MTFLCPTADLRPQDNLHPGIQSRWCSRGTDGTLLPGSLLLRLLCDPRHQALQGRRVTLRVASRVGYGAPDLRGRGAHSLHSWGSSPPPSGTVTQRAQRSQNTERAPWFWRNHQECHTAPRVGSTRLEPRGVLPACGAQLETAPASAT